MEVIAFEGVKNPEKLKEAFDYLSKSKANGNFEEEKLASIMGGLVVSYFINPTKEESLELLKKWKENPNIELRWDFGSWFDALSSAEIAYTNLVVNETGTGKLEFEQLAWPSGGIEATQELIKAFGGKITSNSAM